MGIFLRYVHCEKRRIDEDLKVIPEEATLILQMCLLWPIFYSEVDIFLDNCDKFE